MLHWRIALTALRLPLGCVRLGGRIRIARDKDEAAHEALKAAERALVVALEAQPRAELAASRDGIWVSACAGSWFWLFIVCSMLELTWKNQPRRSRKLQPGFSLGPRSPLRARRCG